MCDKIELPLDKNKKYVILGVDYDATNHTASDYWCGYNIDNYDIVTFVTQELIDMFSVVYGLPKALLCPIFFRLINLEEELKNYVKSINSIE